jgi:hypothetical protein
MMMAGPPGRFTQRFGPLSSAVSADGRTGARGTGTYGGRVKVRATAPCHAA